MIPSICVFQSFFIKIITFLVFLKYFSSLFLIATFLLQNTENNRITRSRKRKLPNEQDNTNTNGVPAKKFGFRQLKVKVSLPVLVFTRFSCMFILFLKNWTFSGTNIEYTYNNK